MSIWLRIRPLLKQVGVLVLVLFLLAVFINLSWFDEDLHPQLQAIKTPQAIPLTNNGFTYLTGFAAADNKDPFDTGKVILERQRTLFRQGKLIQITAEEVAEFWGGADLDEEWQSLFESLSCRSMYSIECADLLTAEVAQKENENARLLLMAQRYSKIRDQSHFREIDEADVFSPLPPYNLLINVSRMQLASMVAHRDAARFLEFVDADMRFWKTMLRDGQLLISKMVALGGLRNDLQFISTGLRQGLFSQEQMLDVQKHLVSLSEAERDISETFLAEMKLNIFSHETQQTVYGDPSWWLKLFWQENATLNTDYMVLVVPIRYLATLNAPEFYQQHGFEKQPFSVRVFPPDIYNLGGKLAMKSSVANYNVQDYISRVHNLDGKINLVALQIELALHPESDVESIVRSSQYRNPYTLMPLDYDKSENTLGFDCLGVATQGLCLVQL